VITPLERLAQEANTGWVDLPDGMDRTVTRRADGQTNHDD